MVGINLLYLVNIDGIVLGTLVSELSKLEALSLTVITTFLIKSLIKRILQKTTFYLINVYLVCCYVPYR